MVWPQVGTGTAAAMETAARSATQPRCHCGGGPASPEFDELPQQHRVVLACDGRTAFLPEYHTDRALLDESLIRCVENDKKHTRADQLAAFDAIASLRPKMDKIAANYAAIITPSVPDEAPLGLEKTGSAAFNCIWTVGFMLPHASQSAANSDTGTAYTCCQRARLQG